MDERTPLVQAVAVSAGRIIAIGSDRDIIKLADGSSKVIDAGKRLVIPGFNDAHVHLTGIGNWFSHLDLTGVNDSPTLKRKIRHFTAFVPKGRWIIGGKLDLGNWKGDRPDLAWVDAAAGDHPLLLYLVDPASAFINSAAMKNAVFVTDDPLVSGPRLARIRNAIPGDHGNNWAEIIEAASNYAVSKGVTSVQDVHSDDLYSTYQKMARDGKLKIRVYECVGLTGWEKGRSATVPAATGDARVRTGCVKWLSNGDVREIPELTERLKKADQAGLQIAVHAIGRRSVENTISALRSVILQNGIRDRRPRIEHAHEMTTAQIKEAGRLGILASMQPALFYSGAEFASDLYPIFLRLNTRLAFGSDASMIDIDPLAGIFSAVYSGPNSLTIYEAVKAYTTGSAYAEFQEKEKGSITKGKLADIVVLSEDIFAIPRPDITKAKVDLTIVDGVIVYSRAATE